jgi:hypothetical protein
MAQREPGHPREVDLEPPPKPWRRRQRDIGYAGWASFLMACAATMVFFAAVDPEILSENNALGWEINRQTGYAIGFFGFWLLTAATSVLVIWLVRTENRPEDVPGIRRKLEAMKGRGGRRQRGARRPRGQRGPGPGGKTSE